MLIFLLDNDIESGTKTLLTFENDETGLFDMSPDLNKGILKKLRHFTSLNTVKVNFYSVELASMKGVLNMRLKRYLFF